VCVGVETTERVQGRQRERYRKREKSSHRERERANNMNGEREIDSRDECVCCVTTTHTHIYTHKHTHTTHICTQRAYRPFMVPFMTMSIEKRCVKQSVTIIEPELFT